MKTRRKRTPTHPIRNRQIRQTQLRPQLLHEINRDRRARCDARSAGCHVRTGPGVRRRKEQGEEGRREGSVTRDTLQSGDGLTYRRFDVSTSLPSSRLRCTSASTPKKCVGTPWSAVQRSFVTASTMATGSYASEGYTMHAPCDQAARFPSTRRKRRAPS